MFSSTARTAHFLISWHICHIYKIHIIKQTLLGKDNLSKYKIHFVLLSAQAVTTLCIVAVKLTRQGFASQTISSTLLSE